jgi:preprotein translocase subunit SecG
VSSFWQSAQPYVLMILNILLVLTSLFLICLVLIQRGKGGGLAGAIGGVGGSCAFGTKAGDVFTNITVGTAFVWFLVAMLLVVLSNKKQRSALDANLPRTSGTTKQIPLDMRPKTALPRVPREGALKKAPATIPTPAPSKSSSDLPPVFPPAAGDSIPAKPGPPPSTTP